MNTLPKKPPCYLRRQQVDALCRMHNIPSSACRALFDPPECPAKKWLPGRQKPLYVRTAVLTLLGLNDEP